MSEEKLETLLTELNNKLQFRLNEIEQDCQSQMVKIEEEQKRDLQIRKTKLRQDNNRHLSRIKAQAMRVIREQQQGKLWDCQAQCIEKLLSDCRETLKQQPPDYDQLQQWISETQIRLQQPDAQHLKLKLNASWIENLEQSDMTVQSTPILGGAILENMNKNVEVDGSWDQRLTLLIPELWQRWYQVVGTNNKN